LGPPSPPNSIGVPEYASADHDDPWFFDMHIFAIAVG
jgi:hypothetical protein